MLDDASKIAILIPCYNEAHSIEDVVLSFRKALPEADVYVYDNNSTDSTASIAEKAGAVVREEKNQGKGNVVRRMFGDIDADIYILIDGDGTYDASAAPILVEQLITHKLDFVNGARQATMRGSYRPGHRIGNRLLTGLVQLIFGRQFHDMLSGYKVMSRRFVKSFPAMSSGFEIETELAVHALELRLPCAEVPTLYRERSAGSNSKLRTYRDGMRVLLLIFRLIKDERPFQFFGLASVAMLITAIVIAFPVFLTYAETGLVPRLPTAVLSLGIVVLGALSFFTGLTLEMITRTRQELKRLVYLSISGQSRSNLEGRR
jgi:glycosyltransferase involved in cell wall biosynthesis